VHRGFLVLDFGSQFTQLIARKLRELGYYSEIHAYDYPREKIVNFAPYGIILSGGPNSVYEPEAPRRSVQELLEIAPVLGICYGMQLVAQEFLGEVAPGSVREYGKATVTWDLTLITHEELKAALRELANPQQVWMSHGDSVGKIPQGFHVIGYSDSQHVAALYAQVPIKTSGQLREILTLQFHPEVHHSHQGDLVLSAFARVICGRQPDWQTRDVVEHLKDNVLGQVASGEHVLVGLSGGVDSTVVAKLLTDTLGKERVHCLFVDTGLLRLNEAEQVMRDYEHLGLNVRRVEAQQQFFQALKGLADPEQKRKAIGKTFIEVFEGAFSQDSKTPVQWLAQGTLYPDVVESFSVRGGPSHTIKSHHNVGGLPEKMRLRLLEPVRELFKDEVRKVGQALGLRREMIDRHPFPGPGLAIRILGEVTREAADLLRKADAIYIEELKKANLYTEIWQAFSVLLPVRSVGVQGDGRTYDRVLALRAVTSVDGMTADWYAFAPQFLARVSNRITNEVKGINRVVYDITSKPPGTIEWE
jgi:GMP synthase (glutamine-hydrolysing)